MRIRKLIYAVRFFCLFICFLIFLRHVKTMTRIGCVGHWANEHCPSYNDRCGHLGDMPLDPQGHYIKCSPWTPWVDNSYPVAQLNHYWTLSLSDFLRKIHRGKGGSYSKTEGAAYRHTGEFHSHATPNKNPFVVDTSLLDRYGSFFADLKQRCPVCFDTSLYTM